ncbi:MAG TPA: cardiolipin synthase [Parasegetibacter sp.]
MTTILYILTIIAYVLSTGVSILIISENRTPSKTLAYLLMMFLLPFVGVIIYFVFGENYRKKKLYKRKLLNDTRAIEAFNNYLVRVSNENLTTYRDVIGQYGPLVKLLVRDSRTPLTINNEVEILQNGENKFEAVWKALESARNHIHIEYYIFEEGKVAEKLKDILLRKCSEGVEVRIIYDDFGSRLSKKYINELKTAGAEIHPFYKIYFPLLSNRHNYRNHRKIIIVDGHIGFVGGINMSDRYVNSSDNKQTYWRDMHLRLAGDSVKMLQASFIINWNFCTETELELKHDYFPDYEANDPVLVQTAFSGPDSDRATIMLSYLSAINSSKRYIYITTPYFIPNESILNALKTAALSGVDVRLLVPGVSDSRFVNAAAKSYYAELLDSGVRIYLYKKGFIHSKAMVCDDLISSVGTANMDIRSFDLNFEVSVFVFDQKVAAEMKNTFFEDLKDAEPINREAWKNRPRWVRIGESFCRLFSPVL